jgi:hypothetical protein
MIAKQFIEPGFEGVFLFLPMMQRIFVFFDFRVGLLQLFLLSR